MRHIFLIVIVFCIPADAWNLPWLVNSSTRRNQRRVMEPASSSPLPVAAVPEQVIPIQIEEPFAEIVDNEAVQVQIYVDQKPTENILLTTEQLDRLIVSDEESPYDPPGEAIYTIRSNPVVHIPKSRTWFLLNDTLEVSWNPVKYPVTVALQRGELSNQTVNWITVATLARDRNGVHGYWRGHFPKQVTSYGMYRCIVWSDSVPLPVLPDTLSAPLGSSGIFAVLDDKSPLQKLLTQSPRGGDVYGPCDTIEVTWRVNDILRYSGPINYKMELERAGLNETISLGRVSAWTTSNGDGRVHIPLATWKNSPHIPAKFFTAGSRYRIRVGEAMTSNLIVNCENMISPPFEIEYRDSPCRANEGQLGPRFNWLDVIANKTIQQIPPNKTEQLAIAYTVRPWEWYKLSMLLSAWFIFLL